MKIWLTLDLKTKQVMGPEGRHFIWVTLPNFGAVNKRVVLFSFSLSISCSVKKICEEVLKLGKRSLVLYWIRIYMVL